MIEKRSIDEIIKSIFLLVSEAKQKNEQLENHSKPMNLLTSDTVIFKPLKKTTIEAKKNDFDWKNIKFTQENKKIFKFDVKKTLINEIKIKSELKFKKDIVKWAEKKIPGILDKHLRDHTKSLLKK